MIEFVQGDMFATPADIRVNTVNCVGVMGAGVALAFKQRYPEMFKDYKHACKNGVVRPGSLHVWKSLVGDWVINFPTKRDWRESSRYEDIADGLDALRDYLQPLGEVTVALPALGCGHGGLEWVRVSEMIKEKLSGLSARLNVYTPSDSKQAGQVVAAAPSQDEILAAEHLGYSCLSPALVEGWGTASMLFAKGDLNVVNRNWIALLPSRSPGEREIRALVSVAVELSSRGGDATVALVHSNRASEELGEIFASHGINVVFLLPFGVLTRKTLSKATSIHEGGLITLASVVPPNLKWSRALFSQSMDVLRRRASAVLLSDPDYDGFAIHRNLKWRDLPTFFLRYDAHTNVIRSTIGHTNATPIGRRPIDGAPNLDGLMATLRHKPTSADVVVDAANNVEAAVPVSLVSSEHEEIPPLHFDLLNFPENRWAEVVNLILQANPLSLTLSVVFGNDGAGTTLKKRLASLHTDFK